ncbi:glycosyltransferase [Nocardioides sp.]|uniref:glycosyltransferase n=1 Tax=Nocardioides sp. TaxID=35761 RepID=UPI002C29E906|nr:glycosyltransferase [Nocardioides sp.]HXH77218.1 glycosyltransferase [Nocardioides sp.]
MVLTARPTALWAIPVSDLAGVARHALDVARVGIPGWRLVFLTPPGALPRELKAAGAAVLEAPFGPGHGLHASVSSLRHAVAKLQPTVVHTHLSYADIVAALAVGHGPRLITTEHGIAQDDVVYHGSAVKARVMSVAHTARLRRFDAAIAVSDATAKAMNQKWHPRRAVTVIHNGLDPEGAPTRPPGLRVLSLARLAPEKRLDRLVDGFAELASSQVAATLTLAGTGPLEGDLRRQVNRIGLEARVRFPGFVDPDAAMSEHDVLAMLSVWENCSYALLDAAAAGLGVVASSVGANPEILPDRCLVDATDRSHVADALARQGLEPTQRPGLDGWPTVTQMTQRIAGVYDTVTGATT